MNLSQSAKPGRKWGMNELFTFNINVINVNVQTFFGNAILPQPMVSSAILDNLEEPAGPLCQADIDFFFYMEDAMPTHPGKQSFVNDFTAFLLKMMDYNDGIRAVCQWRKLKFEMCGKYVDAKVDICITEHSESGDYAEHLLVMQEAKVCNHSLLYGRFTYPCYVIISTTHLGATLNHSLLQVQWQLFQRIIEPVMLLDYH